MAPCKTSELFQQRPGDSSTNKTELPERKTMAIVVKNGVDRLIIRPHVAKERILHLTRGQ